MCLAVLGAPAVAQAGEQTLRFPRDFAWGVAISAFQSEMGGRPANTDRRSDWWVWTHDRDNIARRVVSGDLPERGPGSWRVYATDAKLAKGLGVRVFRLSIEWSRIFPRPTTEVRVGRHITRQALRALDRLADHRAVVHYRRVLKTLRHLGLRPFVTLNHFTLPLWLHDPLATRAALAARGPDDPLPPGLDRAGWLSSTTAREFRKYAAYMAWRFGDLVDDWITLNEPLVVVTSGFVNAPGSFSGNFPPGVLSFTGAVAAVRNLEVANTLAYDAIHALDRRDADGDGRRAQVGIVHNMAAFEPLDPASAADRRGAEHADWLFNRLILAAVVRGDQDRNANGRIDPPERARHRRKADFIGVNYYLRVRVQGAAAPLSRAIPIADFLPRVGWRNRFDPSAPPCPTLCADVGWEVFPLGLERVLSEVDRYRLPVYITENGIADEDDDLRPAYIVQHLAVLARALRKRIADVRGYFHWSLVDNYEWALGFGPKFGLYSFDPNTLARRPRRSARVYREIVRRNAVTRSLLERYPLPVIASAG